MLFHFLGTALLISIVYARPASEQLSKRAYENYGSNKVRGGMTPSPTPPESFCGPGLISVFMQLISEGGGFWSLGLRLPSLKMSINRLGLLTNLL